MINASTALAGAETSQKAYASLEHLDGHSIRDNYQDSIASLGQKLSLQNSAADGLRNFYDTLKGQHLAISGVNIDEESILMITDQRAFQASSRVIQTAAEILELLDTVAVRRRSASVRSISRRPTDSKQTTGRPTISIRHAPWQSTGSFS